MVRTKEGHWSLNGLKIIVISFVDMTSRPVKWSIWAWLRPNTNIWYGMGNQSGPVAQSCWGNKTPKDTSSSTQMRLLMSTHVLSTVPRLLVLYLPLKTLAQSLPVVTLFHAMACDAITLSSGLASRWILGHSPFGVAILCRPAELVMTWSSFFVS